MNSNNPLFDIPEYRVSLLGTETVSVLQDLLERCADYNQLVSGEPTSSSAAQTLLKECPPGRPSDDKVVFGISATDGSLVGVLDVMRDYPQEGCWWVGLLLLDPSSRNQGLGQQIYQSFEHWAAQFNVKYIFLGVIDENEKTYRFWQQMGFEVVEKQPPRKIGLKDQVIITMVRTITNKTNSI
jgi:GNAT superfamily N-acetyltransferase